MTRNTTPMQHGPFGGIQNNLGSPLPRAILLFFSGYLINGTLHELSHALTAYSLHVQSTLFHFYVNVDRVHASIAQRAWIGVAGPLCSLVIGGLCWLAYKRARETKRELPLLYLATFGVSMFLGNSVSTAFVGDFSTAAVVLNVPMLWRYTVSIAGAVSLSVFMFFVGKQLLRWAPARVNRWAAVGNLVALPVAVGTGLVILAYLPMPANFAVGLAMTSLFWVFAAVGVFVNANRPHDQAPHFPVGWADGVVAVVALLLIRLLVRGLPFTP